MKKSKKAEFNLFKTITLTWWQAKIFKSAAVAFGILLGTYFYDFFGSLLPVIWVVFVVSSFYIISIWKKQ